MKKKFFSSLLMGALVATTLGTVTSCKDYDDDINNLQEQISKLATKDELSSKVSELQGLVSTNSSAISSLQTAVAGKTTLDEVKALLADYATKQYVNDADATLQAAIEALKTKDIADLKAAVEAAQKAADAADAKADANLAEVKKMLEEYATQEDVDAVQAIADAAKAKAEANEAALAEAAKVLGAGFDETNTVAAAIAAIKAQIGTPNAELGSLDARLAAVEAVLNGAEGDESLTELAQKVIGIENDLKGIIGEYTTMVTDVDLYVTSANKDYRNGLPGNTLSFIFLDQEKTTTFPAKEGIADAQIEFSAENKNVTTTDSLVVRVSPTNAELTASNISLINSQGVELSDLVEVADVKPYKNLITTRSASQGNGLWMVTFKVKEGADAAKLAEEVAVKRGDKSYMVKYAVAVKNTASADTRRVVSAYDVNVSPADYEPAKSDILVDNRDGIWFNINNVHNRFTYTDKDNFGASSANETGRAQYKKDVPEYKWKNEPQVAGTTSEMVLAANDARVSNKLIDVTVGKDININVASILDNNGQPVEDNNYVGTGSVYYNATGAAIKGFYVTLDKDFAIESNPSEWNAWKKYAYTNVGIPSGDKDAKPAKLFTGKQGYISIDDEDAIGDIIGFRVYVVNLDGTLVDPDGRAFYVQVDKQKESAQLTATALDAKLEKNVAFNTSTFNYRSDKVELTEGVFEGTDYTNIYDAIGYMEEGQVSRHSNQWIIDVNPTAYGNNAVEPVFGGNGDYNIFYLDKDSVATADPAKAVYAKVVIINPQKFLDNGVYTAHTTLYRKNGTEVRTISVTFSKQMPTKVNSLAWFKSFDPAKQVFTNTPWADGNIYKISEGSTPEAIKLTDKMDGLAGEPYTLYVKEMRKYDDKTATITTPYYLTVKDVEDIDNEARTIDYSYNFGPISLTYNYETAQYKKDDYKLKSTAEQQLKMNFNSWIDFESIKWAAKEEPVLTYKAGLVNQPTVLNFGLKTATTPAGKANTKVKYNGKDCDVYEYAIADGTKVYAIEVSVTTADGLVTKYVTITEGANVQDGTAVSGELKEFDTIFSTGYLERKNVQHDTPASSSVVDGDNKILAWNSEVANYDGNNNSIFGISGKEVNFYGLLNTYLTIEKVEFAPATLYNVTYNNGVITLTQRTFTVNPTTEGTLTFTAKDCFGHKKSWNLKVKIAK